MYRWHHLYLNSDLCKDLTVNISCFLSKILSCSRPRPPSWDPAVLKLCQHVCACIWVCVCLWVYECVCVCMVSHAFTRSAHKRQVSRVWTCSSCLKKANPTQHTRAHKAATFSLSARFSILLFLRTCRMQKTKPTMTVTVFYSSVSGSLQVKYQHYCEVFLFNSWKLCFILDSVILWMMRKRAEFSPIG